ncbi:phage tail tape measure protein, partial [Streptomyces sp. bgisy153]|uniref:phage tail tape measure protein n=1 Tax=Streptomyces sp. bgisy153 TaxID=3413793 RepID=UPI003D70B43A
AKEAIAKLGLQTTDSHGKMLPLLDIIRQLEKSGASTADMMKIFGVEAGPGMQALVSQGSKALEGLTTDLQNSGGTAERIAKTQMEGLNGSLKTLQSAFEGLMIAIGDSGLLAWATKFVTALGAWVQGLSKTNPMLLKLAVVVGAVLAAVGPILAVVGWAIPAIGTALGLLVSPVALIVGAIVLLGAAFAIAMAKSEAFRNTVMRAAGAVKGWLVGAAMSAYTTFQKNLMPALTGLWQTIQTKV